MNPDDIIYITILLLSVPFGFVIKSISQPRYKQYTSCLIGVIILCVVCSYHVWHSITTIIINCLIIKACGPSRCHWVSFVWCFGYIIFFRTTAYFGIATPTPHANAVQLLLTLKLVGLAFEVNQSYKLKKKLSETTADKDVQIDNKLKYEYYSIQPTTLDMLLYSYCYIGLLTGPYYKYRTYQDMINNANSSRISVTRPLMMKLAYAIATATSYLVANHFFSIKYVTTDEFYDRPFWYRLFYFVPMFFVFRTRLYFAWLMAEAMCVTATLGCYPIDSKPSCGHGPNDLKQLKASYDRPVAELEYNYECVRNVDIYATEMSPTVRDGLRSWNRGVQYWLAFLVYKNIPWRIPVVRMSITMGVSAFWHGVYPGYYLSLLTVPFVVAAEDRFHKTFRVNLTPTQEVVFDWCNWFLKMRLFDYMCMAFMLLSMEDTIRYWRSIYFLGHVVTAVFFILGTVFAPKRQRKVVDEKKTT